NRSHMGGHAVRGRPKKEIAGAAGEPRRRRRRSEGRSLLGGLLAALLAAGPVVLLLELLDAAGRVHELHLAGEERVRGAGDVQRDQRVLLAVLPDGGLVRLGAGARQEREVGRRVLEDHGPVVGVDALLHVKPRRSKAVGTSNGYSRNRAGSR